MLHSLQGVTQSLIVLKAKPVLHYPSAPSSQPPCSPPPPGCPAPSSPPCPWEVCAALLIVQVGQSVIIPPGIKTKEKLC